MTAPFSTPAGNAWVLCGSYDRSRAVVIRCNNPAPVLVALDRVKEELACDFRLWVRDIDPLAWSVRRILEEVRQ